MSLSQALDTVIKCELAAFDVLQQGPTVLSIKMLNERVEKIEQSAGQPKQEHQEMLVTN